MNREVTHQYREIWVQLEEIEGKITFSSPHFQLVSAKKAGFFVGKPSAAGIPTKSQNVPVLINIKNKKKKLCSETELSVYCLQPIGSPPFSSKSERRFGGIISRASDHLKLTVER